MVVLNRCARRMNSPEPFLIMPTSCTGPLQSSVEGDSWAQIGQYTAPKTYGFENAAGESFGLDGCNRLSFEPSMTSRPTGSRRAPPPV